MVLCAPTGRAAKRMSETTGEEASYTVTPEKTTDENGNDKYVLGITIKPETERGFFKSIVYAFNEECA